MAGLEIKVVGSDRLAATLRDAANKLGDFQNPARAAASIAAATARGIAPARTGALRGSIRASSSKRVGIITAGSGLRYARPVHWGSPARGIPARPFLSTGAQASEAIWVRGYQEHVNNTIKKVKGK